MNTLLLLTLLMLKHTIADYVMQTSWMITDKSQYGKQGGIAHAGFHGILTALILLLFSVPFLYALILSMLESSIHYHIDYIKSKWMRKNNPSPNSQLYWTAHGIDQYLHYLTYVLLIILLV